MERITIKTKELDSNYCVGDLNISSQINNVMKFYGIPQSLKGVDKKFNTNVLHQVIEAAAPTLDVIVDSDRIQVLDPRSSFMEDEEFSQLVDMSQEVSGAEAVIVNEGFQKKATIQLADKDTDSYLGDVFKRSWSVVRRAEGGLSFSTDILRLACTNGMVIPDKQYSGFIRSSKADHLFVTSFHDAASEFSVDKYLQSLFTHNGEQIPCSVADMWEMHSCLASLTDDDTADVLFPIQTVSEFYAEQAIELSNLSRKYLDKLPSGFTYYQALQILTNGAKLMAEKTIDNEIKVASFCKARRVHQMKDVDLHFEGSPSFSLAKIHSLMGDGVSR